VFTNLKSGEGVERVIGFIVSVGGLGVREAPAQSAHTAVGPTP
jgi:hypothetical protein